MLCGFVDYWIIYERISVRIREALRSIKEERKGKRQVETHKRWSGKWKCMKAVSAIQIRIEGESARDGCILVFVERPLIGSVVTRASCDKQAIEGMQLQFGNHQRLPSLFSYVHYRRLAITLLWSGSPHTQLQHRAYPKRRMYRWWRIFHESIHLHNLAFKFSFTSLFISML